MALALANASMFCTSPLTTAITLMQAPKICSFRSAQHRSVTVVCAQNCVSSAEESDVHLSSSKGSRRLALCLLAAASFSSASALNQVAFSEPSTIKVEGPPPPSGGLPGTENADEARDLEKPLKERFYLQPLPPESAAIRVKESLEQIIGVKSLIDKKAWPYVQNDLRSKAEYLRFDLNTIISAKPKEEKKALKALTAKLFDSINNLDFAARSKSTPQAEKYYAETITILNDVLTKIA